MSIINLVINPKKSDLGDNFIVRRSLPNVKKRFVGPFVFWDHMGPAKLFTGKDMKVRAHPHIGLATITWLFKGSILHRDSLGNEQFIKPGEVNWMTAGSGIVHSERSFGTDEGAELEGIQLWLALPKEHEDVQASFFHCKADQIPSFEYHGFDISLIAGEFSGVKSPVPVYSKLFYLTAQNKEDRLFEYHLNSREEAAIYLVDGKITIDGEVFYPGQLIVIKENASVRIEVSANSKFMFFGGQVFPEKRHIWWNFVSTSPEKIEKAKKMWTDGEFPQVINETEFIPLPKS